MQCQGQGVVWQALEIEPVLITHSHCGTQNICSTRRDRERSMSWIGPPFPVPHSLVHSFALPLTSACLQKLSPEREILPTRGSTRSSSIWKRCQRAEVSPPGDPKPSSSQMTTDVCFLPECTLLCSELQDLINLCIMECNLELHWPNSLEMYNLRKQVYQLVSLKQFSRSTTM